MSEHAPSRREGAPSRRAWMRRPWLVTTLLLVALLLGFALGVLIGLASHPLQVAAGPVCPSSAHRVTWPSPPTQVVHYSFPSTPPTVTLQPSQTLEVELFGSGSWHLATPDVSPTLILEMPAGYLDAFGQSCVWRFTAQQVGSEQLDFSSPAMCQGTECSGLGASLQLTVIVSASQAGSQSVPDAVVAAATPSGGSAGGGPASSSVQPRRLADVACRQLLAQAVS